MRRRYMMTKSNKEKTIYILNTTSGYDSGFLAYFINADGNYIDVSDISDLINGQSFELIYSYTGNPPTSFSVVYQTGLKVNLQYPGTQLYVYKMTFKNRDFFFKLGSGNFTNKELLGIFLQLGFTSYVEDRISIIDY